MKLGKKEIREKNEQRGAKCKASCKHHLRMQSLDVGQPISSCLIKTIFILNIVSSLCCLYRGLAELIFSVTRNKMQCILNHIGHMLWDKFNF